MNLRLMFLTGLSLLLFSCKKDEPKPIITDPKPGQPVVWVLNEGNFTWGNGNVTQYFPETGEVVQDAFAKENGFPLGDVPQSITVADSTGFIVVNNSGKIEVVDLKTGKSKGRISGLTSPRFMVISGEKAYVSDFVATKIHIINLNTLSVTGSITTSGWTERMELSDGKLFVTVMGNNQVYIIDVTQDVVIDSVQVGREPNSIVAAADGKLWVLCSGGFSESHPKLVVINPQTHQVEKEWQFDELSSSPSTLTINKTKTAVYWLNEDVYRMQVSDQQLPQQPFISRGSRNFYALGVNPKNDDLYVTEAADYVSPGKVWIYSAAGAEKGSFAAGVNPGWVEFVGF